MEGAEPAAGGATTGRRGDPGADDAVLMSSKPLHRFVQREPGSLGIVLVVCGCAEILMGFHLAAEPLVSSYKLYIPIWEGALFLISGNLSIYTERQPSKKMVTVTLSMYLVSFFGVLVSFSYRVFCFSYLHHTSRWRHGDWLFYQTNQLVAVEGVLFVTSVCVGVILIFLSCVARLALRSTRTQVIVHCVPAAPQSETTTD
ncbi:uncharacterized protein LOC114864007 [Betta splendens]|uniref:Uncharacterized protein LOC114864007 n=1 Tax=Betta splendens TaxID=158456 RepID=A0A6P7NSB7_BETSP|nr:uncharacterized protein LOC114864007 [Betta splendens]XP_029020430.1 uncharacterized protein LOC114864007 [Betta splendens]